MIIDVHGHYTTAPAELQAYRGRQVNSMGRPTKGRLNISDDQICETLEKGQLQKQRERGTDVAIFSPIAAAMGHHFGNELTSRYWAEVNNELIYRACKLYPQQFIGACQLPQSPGVSPANCVEELERCVKEFGFVGCNLNPDPSGGYWTAPPLGDEWWYPLYEKLVELQVPALIHVAAACNPAFHTTGSHYINGDTTAIMQLAESRVYEDFPTLTFIIPHGGGAVPYQMARYRAINILAGRESFDDFAKRLYFDTAIYNQDAMETLIKAVGVDNVLFASEMIGAANAIDPETGRWFDDNKPYLDAISWLTDADRQKIFEDNAKKAYPRLQHQLELQHQNAAATGPAAAGR
ncbi:MAG: amidohydrolase family protein [Dehalococcoidia bacterium]